MARRLVAAAVAAGLWASVAFAGAPNLQITSISCPPIIKPGQTIVVDNTVAEVRNEDASTTFTVGIYLSDNARIDPGVDIWLGEWVVSGGLAASTSDSDSTVVTLPAILAPGDYFIGAYADIDDVVGENNRNDSGSSVPVTMLTPGGLRLEDITPLGGGCSPGGGGGPGAAAWFLPLLMLGGVLAVARRASRGASGTRPVAAGLLVLLALFAVVVSGCGGMLLGADEAGPVEARSMADGSPDVTRLGSRLPAAMPGEVRQFPVGVRTGLLMTAGEDTMEYDGSVMLGAYYPGQLRGLFGLDAIPFEAGLDFAFASESETYSIDSTLILLRFDCLFSKWPAAQSDADLYFLGGYKFVGASWDRGGREDSEHASGLDIGVGLSWAEIGLDARVTWTKLLGSDNIGSLFLFTAGYRF
jgi:MYXO-CTERM domain-containing protein